MTTTRPGRVRTAAALSTSVLAVAGLVGCGSSETTLGSGSSSSSSGSSSGSRTMTVQFVNPLPSYPSWRTTGDCMEEAAEKAGVDLTESGPTGQAPDPTAMIQQVQQATAAKKDAIITWPLSDGFTPVLQQARDQGAVVGTIYGAGGEDSGSDLNVGPDFAYIGKTLVEAVAALPGDHVLGLVASGDTGLGKAWMDGVKAAVAQADNVTIAGEVYTNDDATRALPQVTSLLTQHPDVTEIMTHMGTITPGAVSAIRSSGLEGKTFLLVGGHDNGGTEAIDSGVANLMLMQDVCSMGEDVLDGVVEIHRGGTAPDIPVKIVVATKDEVQGYLDQGWV